MYTVRRETPRPPAEAVEALRPFPTTVLSDALGRYGAMDAGIKPIADGMAFCGIATTVKTFAADNLMVHLGVKLAKPGDVLVIDADGVTDTAVMGELVAASAKRQGLVGTVIDGAIRDKVGMRELGWPVFARAAVPNGPFKADPGVVNVPIACGGVVVNPGDIVVGDDDGVVVVPQVDWQAVAQAAQAIVDREGTTRARILAGEYMWDMQNMDKALAGFKVRWE